MTDRQLELAAKAISDAPFPSRNSYKKAQAAIEASDARFVPMLVEALKAMQRIARVHSSNSTASIIRIVDTTLNQLPEELIK